jgi:diamine N-acetyltransferase
MITLQQVNESNWRRTLALTVHPAQQRFIADYVPIAAIALAKAYIRPSGMTWIPYAIFANQQMVGFVEIALEPGQPKDCWVFHFFIDHRFQGHGYGKAAIHALVAMIREIEPNCTGVSLVVHPENVAAQYLYQSVGFEATGEEQWGEPAYRLGFE